MAQYRNQLRRKSNKFHIFNFKLLFHIADTYFITKFHFIKLLIFTLYFLQNIPSKVLQSQITFTLIIRNYRCLYVHKV